MVSETIKRELSAAAERKMNRFCCICGKKITAPHEILGEDEKPCCDACYRASFFVDMDCTHHRVLDYCDG